MSIVTMTPQGVLRNNRVTSSRRPLSERALSSAREPGSPARASCAGVEVGPRDLVFVLGLLMIVFPVLIKTYEQLTSFSR